MRFLRTIQADLRERQIFPAVILLAVLAIAIPIVAPLAFGTVSTPTAITPTPEPVKLPKGLKAPVAELAALNSPASTATPRHGAEPNPFREAPAATTPGSAAGGSSTTTSKTTVTKPTSTTTVPKPTSTYVVPKPTSPKTKPKTPVLTPVGSTGSTGSSGASSPATATPVTGPASLSADQAYTVDLDTRDSSGLHVLTGVVRLATFPSADSPEAIYLGVLQGGQKAAFLFPEAVAISNKGVALTCLPDAADCQIVELSPGQGVSLYSTANSSRTTTFTFELVSIGATTYPSASAADSARAAVSTAGQTLLPLSQSTALATLTYDDKLGALVHHSTSTTKGSTGSTGSVGATGSASATGSQSEARGVPFTAKSSY